MVAPDDRRGDAPWSGRGDKFRDVLRCCCRCWRKLPPAEPSGIGASVGGTAWDALLREAILLDSLRLRAMLTICAESISRPWPLVGLRDGSSSSSGGPPFWVCGLLRTVRPPSCATEELVDAFFELPVSCPRLLSCCSGFCRLLDADLSDVLVEFLALLGCDVGVWRDCRDRLGDLRSLAEASRKVSCNKNPPLERVL